MVGVPGLKPVIGDVTNGSLAAQAGLHQGDLITSVQGHAVATREDAFVYLFDQLVEGSVQLTVQGDEGAGASRTLVLHADHQLVMDDPDNLMTGLGFDFWYPKIPAVIGVVKSGSPAESAGLKVGDLIVSIDGQPMDDFSAVAKLIGTKGGQTVHIKIDRASAIMELPVTVGEQIEADKKMGKIGAGNVPVEMPQSMQMLQRYGVIPGAAHAVTKTWEASKLDLKVIGQMLTGKLSVKNIAARWALRR